MTTDLWFPTPVYSGDLSPDEFSLVSREIDNAMQAAPDAFGTPWREPALSTTFKYDGKSNIIVERQMRHLASQVMRHTQQFCADLGIDRYQSMEIENSWINVSKPKGFQFAHTHEPSMVSGVYYHRTSGEDGNIVFESPNVYFNTYDFPNNGRQCQRTIEYKPQAGRLILFPSWLSHYVDVNRTQQERISLSFNLRLRRTLA